MQQVNLQEVTMSRTVLIISALFIGLAAYATAGQLAVQGHDHMHHHQNSSAEMNSVCPFRLDGVTYELTEVEDGVVLTYSVEAAKLEELRKRVYAAAQMMTEMHSGETPMMGGHDQHQMMHSSQAGEEGKEMPCHAGMQCAEHQTGAMQMKKVPFTVRAEDTPDGARLVFTPADPADRSALLSHLEQMTKQMPDGGCMFEQMMPDQVGEPGQTGQCCPKVATEAKTQHMH
jgi:hypothetical protein